MKKKVTSIILCGGKGERLRPLTKDIPKPLINVNKKPILSYIFDHLLGSQLENFIIATGYKAEKIESYLEEIDPSFNYKIINSGDTDIIRRIQDSKDQITNDFMVLYGDTISDVDISELINFHNSHSNPITITVWPLKTEFGVVELSQESQVISFEEKPELGKWINIGYFYFDHEMIKMLCEYDSFEDFLIDASERRLLSAYKHRKMHLTINNLSELSKAEEELNKLVKD
tara:strand:- start:132 stop:821 length:690 start_codon:yes stop_codon:yes gene_type:complete